MSEDTQITHTQPPVDENGLTYVVITEGASVFETGEILVCAPLPGTSVREIGYPSRKPLKYSAEYEMFSDPKKAVQRREELNPRSRGWVPTKSNHE